MFFFVLHFPTSPYPISDLARLCLSQISHLIVCPHPRSLTQRLSALALLPDGVGLWSGPQSAAPPQSPDLGPHAPFRTSPRHKGSRA